MIPKRLQPIISTLLLITYGVLILTGKCRVFFS